MGAGLQGLRLFISYARGGRSHSVARALRVALSEHGAEVFLDEVALPPGSTALSGQLARAIEQAHALVFLLGETTHKCDWQEREARYAQDHAVPVLVVQTCPVTPPLYVYDAVPIPALGRLPEWLPALVAALQCQARPAAPVPLAASAPQAQTVLEQAVHRYLADLLAGELADRTTRYTPLVGRQCEQSSPLKGRRGLRFATTMVTRLHEAPGKERTFTDALDAFRALPQTKQPRLAVLGEPGAGKSFTLERLFCEWAEAVLRPTPAQASRLVPVPLLVRLGDWTRSAEPLEDFLTDQLRQQGAPEALAHGWRTLRDERRAVLLLDAFNEIPVGQRVHKAPQVQKLAEDARWAAVLISCRERDFTQTLALPFDTLTLQPLKPAQVMDYLYRWELVNYDEGMARRRAERQFWQLAAGDQAAVARVVCEAWVTKGGSFEQFWEADDSLPHKTIRLYEQQIRHELGHNPRSLLRLASSPFWLALLVECELLGAQRLTRLHLVDEFLKAAYADGKRLCERRNALDELPELNTWHQVLMDVALALQHGAASTATAADDETGAQTRLPREQAPANLTPQLLEFSIGVQVLKESSGQLHFSHQLLQEAMAAQAMLDAAQGGWPEATRFWPASHWWQRNGWEVVAEMVGESLAEDAPAFQSFIAWLAVAQPELALRVWQQLGSPALPPELREHIRRTWLPGMTDPTIWPRPEARAAIGRTMAGFDLDNRPGIGLRPDGLPDIDWVEFNDGQPFIYQEERHPGLPPFALARYPVTHRQFQAFVDAADGYGSSLWWRGFEDQKRESPQDAEWPQANCPRENVCWFEAVAFCRWLTHRLGLPPGQVVRLPTEREWEHAARGRTGWACPSAAQGYVVGHANCDESGEDDGASLQRTSAVGLYPQGATSEGSLLDMVGNVWEWCADTYDPEDAKKGECADVERVVCGGSWLNNLASLRTADRAPLVPGSMDSSIIGFRVCRASPI